MAHILITDENDNQYVVKKTDIRRVYRDKITKKTTVCFTGAKNTPIRIKDSVEGFFNIHLTK